MATNLQLDDSLIEKAVEVGKHPSKKAAVTCALQEYIRRHEQLDILNLFGQLDFDPEYDYKRARRSK